VQTWRISADLIQYHRQATDPTHQREQPRNMLAALLIIPILTILIFLHELGHYTMARRAGVRVEEFGIGLPPRLWGYKRGDTIWSINWIPLGGFVRVLGEDGKDFSEESMQAKTPGQRATFLAAGSIMNFLTALVLIGVLLVGHGDPSSNVYVMDVVPDSPAESGGLVEGDRVLDIDGEPVSTDDDFRAATQDSLGTPMAVTVLRNGVEETFEVIPRENPPVGEGATGVRISNVTVANVVFEDVAAGSIASGYFEPGDQVLRIGNTEVIDSVSYDTAINEYLGETVEAVVERDGAEVTVALRLPASLGEDGETLGAEVVADIVFTAVNPLRAVPMTVVRFFEYIQLMFDGLVMILNGEIPLSDFAGPIGMGQLTSEVVEQSTVPQWVAVVTIMILLSLNLGLLNLLPLPALDGGRLMFVAIEVLRRGKRVAPEKEGLVHMVGLVMLLTLMIAIAFIDIDRIISGQSLLQ
jgi:regulator of sigma E protease